MRPTTFFLDVLLEGSCYFTDHVSLSEKRDIQIFLKEILTEALTKIIVFNYASKNNNMSFNNMITESIPRSESYTFIGGMILGSIGLDNIK